LDSLCVSIIIGLTFSSSMERREVCLRSEESLLPQDFVFLSCQIDGVDYELGCVRGVFPRRITRMIGNLARPPAVVILNKKVNFRGEQLEKIRPVEPGRSTWIALKEAKIFVCTSGNWTLILEGKNIRPVLSSGLRREFQGPFRVEIKGFDPMMIEIDADFKSELSTPQSSDQLPLSSGVCTSAPSL